MVPSRFRHTHALIVSLVVVIVSLSSSIIVLWYYGRVALPPAVAQGLRRVGARLAQSPFYPKPKATVLLDVPFHKQEQALSCEVAALKMALAGVGVNVEESELVRLLPFDTTPKGSGIWGDPDEGFVGDIDGKMLLDGYGVYAKPIRDLGSKWRKTAILEKPNAAALATALGDGAPIVVWGYFGSGKRYTWKTPEGKTVNAIYAEHARTVVGYAGPAENPDGFFVLDPKYGQQYWKRDAFMKNWDALDRMHVVVYPESSTIAKE